ncbi:MAG: hypothetical protein JKY65_32170 [Planctomycetes bacterium]|nr:hypothetical protein [Planctomycetota bacterium]
MTLKNQLSHRLRHQLAPILDPWVATHGREEAKRLLLASLAHYFDDDRAESPRLTRLQVENRELRAQLSGLVGATQVLTGPTGLVARVERETFALGVPLAVDDRQALESLVTTGSERTAEALSRLLVAQAEQEAQGPLVVESTSALDPRGGSESARELRTRHAQDQLFEAATRTRSGRDS